jgi:uncharacterized protein
MIWTALMIGFVGSAHCLGMCSPLAMAVTNLSPRAFMNRLLYNLGRILTYSIMGAIVASISFIFPFGKFQNVLSILLGLSLLVVGLGGVSTLKIPFISTHLARFSMFLKTLFGNYIQRNGYTPMFILGSLNGLLPCGLSFFALAYCISLRGPIDGFAFMAWFGIGTLPVMLGLTGMFSWASKTFNLSAKKLTTAMLIASGILLIARVFIVHLPHGTSISEHVTDIVLCR